MNGVVTVKRIPAANVHCLGKALPDVIDDLKRPVTVYIPKQAVVPMYADGTIIRPTWDKLDYSRVRLEGILAATDAGEYEVTAKLGPRSIWPDGTTDPKILRWRIARAPCQMTLDKSALDLNDDAATGYVTVTRTGNGAIRAESNAPDIAAVTVDGEQIIVTGLESGSALITVSVAQSANHEAASVTIPVNVSLTTVSEVFAENSWETIQRVTRKGDAPKWWKVGDTKPIDVSGTVLGCTITGTYDTLIAGFNHNSAIEGDNTLHLVLPRNDGKDTAWCDSRYNTNITSGTGFCMNIGGGTANGWAGCNMHVNGMPAFLTALPSDLRAVLKPCTKYTSNAGTHNTAADVTDTQDTVFMLSEFELFGTQSYGNTYEKDKQKQYDYWKNGAAKTRYKTTATGTSVYLWTRTAARGNSTNWVYVSTSGGASTYTGACSHGICIGCMIA